MISLLQEETLGIYGITMAKMEEVLTYIFLEIQRCLLLLRESNSHLIQLICYYSK